MVGLVLGFALLVGGHSDWAESRRWWALAAAAGVLAWLAAGFRVVPRILVALALLAVTAVELQQARPAAEYHQLVPDVAYDDPGPVMERLGRERGRYVTIAWDRPTTAEERRSVAVPAGFSARMGRYYREAWPRRLAARPAWEDATNAETVSGRDGGLLPLRTYQEFFAAAVNSEARLTAEVTTQAPSKWGWPALDLLGVRWFVTNGLPPEEIEVMEERGFRVVQREAFFLLWERAPLPLARLYHDVDVVADPVARLARLRAGYPLGERVMVERPVGGLGRPARPAEVRVEARAHTRVEVSVSGDAGGLLVLGDPWYPQWRVEVDGRPAELLRVDHAFRGVRVPAGQHRVVFTYQDQALRAGLLVSVLVALGLAGLWGWRRRQGRLRPPEVAGPRPAGSP